MSVNEGCNGIDVVLVSVVVVNVVDVDVVIVGTAQFPSSANPTISLFKSSDVNPHPDADAGGLKTEITLLLASLNPVATHAIAPPMS